MNNIINVLPSKLVDQIAAGEVIERPASVVKELVENSIDAQANEIKIIVEDGGKTLIQIIDNGIGMSRDDIILSFKRHATSKLKEHSDLESINSMGFRGEALPSIASVSQVDILSRTKNETSGYRYTIIGGTEKKIESISTFIGTSITIKNLFFNTPARKKFLKTSNSEYRQITQIVRVFLLSHPNISFKFIHNNKTLYDLRSKELKNRLLNIYGQSIDNSLIKVNFKNDYLKINGFIGNLNLVRKRPSNQFLYLNKRYIKDRLLASAINKGYVNLLERGEFPFYVLYININPKHVDFNVHPTKKEVRFENEWKVYELLKETVANHLSNINETLPNFSKAHPISSGPSFFKNDQFKSNTTQEFYNFDSKPVNINEILSENEITDDKVKRNFDTMFEKTQNELFNINGDIWQVANKYLITEVSDGLIIIDQHVAHERILFEEALVALEGDGLTSQTVLFPETIQFQPDEYNSFLNILKHFEKIGFKIRDFGKNTIIVDGLPSSIPLGNESNLLKNILDEYMKYKDNDTSFIHNIAASYACKGAIKAGDALNQEEMLSLINKLFSTNNPYYCPHGRPIIVRMSEHELDKRFERK